MARACIWAFLGLLLLGVTPRAGARRRLQDADPENSRCRPRQVNLRLHGERGGAGMGW